MSAGSHRSRRNGSPARGSRLLAQGRPGWQPPSSSLVPGTRSSSTSASDAPGGLAALWHSRVQDGESLCWIVASGRCMTRAPTSVVALRSGSRSPGDELKERYDAIVLAVGSTIGRELPVPGRELGGIHQAMEFLPQANRIALGRHVDDQISAKGKHVVIIGGGDTGADCLGTAIRQQPKSIVQLEIMPTPPDERPENQPWPTYPMIYRVSSAHEEAGERVYSVSTSEFIGDYDDNVASLRMSEVRFEGGKIIPIEGTEREIPAELVLLAMGFVGPETDTVISQLGVALDERGNVARDEDYATDVDGVFVCGDAGRGQSLIVWAIAEGRACAAGVDEYLSGSTKLPRPIPPTARQMMV